jgi:UDP-N-acetylglucosamine--N-acetylmuramyl-(pentapeptide) pyrophosphoryl-undecaprenol N-acetylglucosamine transferase
VTGYPVRSELSSWSKTEAYHFFGFRPDLPTLLVTGGSLGSLTINQALVAVLPELLREMQVIHLTGQLTWPKFSKVKASLEPGLAGRYQGYPYLHEEMGAAFCIANLVLSRAGASSIGEYPHFGIPAILVPYPHAWRYQKVNADFLTRNGAAVVLNDRELPSQLFATVTGILQAPERLEKMQQAMRALAFTDAARAIGDQILEAAALKNPVRN